MKLKSWIPALLCGAGLLQAKSPVETYGALSIKGNALVDASGNKVTLRGMSLCGHYDMGCKEFWTPGVLSYVMLDWHASIIRAPVKVDNESISNGTLSGYISDTADAMLAIRRVIGGAIQCGMYVIVDWHTEGVHYEANNFFGSLAKQYGNTPNIIWEIYNEPTTDWGTVASYAKSVIPTIRKYSQNVILVGNPMWDQQPNTPGGDLNGFSNIAYTVHFYNDQSHWGTVSDAMNNKGHAVFASEWGMSDHTGGGGFQDVNSGNIATWLNDMEGLGVSTVNWSLGHALANAGQGPGTETSAALTTTAATSPNALNPWTNADITGDGQSIRGWLQQKNPVWTLPDTTTKLTSPLVINSTKTTGFVSGDPISFGASYNHSELWTLTETGRTSKSKFTTKGQGSNVVAGHNIGSKDLLTPAWANETVDAVLQPLGSTVSYTISGMTSGIVRVQSLYEGTVRWEGTQIQLPENSMAEGTPVQVRIRNPQGQVLWSKDAVVGANNHVDLAQTQPHFSGVRILEVNSSDAIVRSRFAPAF